MRRKIGKKKSLRYMIVSAHPDASLVEIIQNPPYEKVILATSQNSKIPKKLEKLVDVVRLGKNKVNRKLMKIINTERCN